MLAGDAPAGRGGWIRESSGLDRGGSGPYLGRMGDDLSASHRGRPPGRTEV